MPHKWVASIERLQSDRQGCARPSIKSQACKASTGMQSINSRGGMSHCAAAGTAHPLQCHQGMHSPQSKACSTPGSEARDSMVLTATANHDAPHTAHPPRRGFRSSLQASRQSPHLPGSTHTPPCNPGGARWFCWPVLRRSMCAVRWSPCPSRDTVHCTCGGLQSDVAAVP